MKKERRKTTNVWGFLDGKFVENRTKISFRSSVAARRVARVWLFNGWMNWIRSRVRQYRGRGKILPENPRAKLKWHHRFDGAQRAHIASHHNKISDSFVSFFISFVSGYFSPTMRRWRRSRFKSTLACGVLRDIQQYCNCVPPTLPKLMRASER